MSQRNALSFLIVGMMLWSTAVWAEASSGQELLSQALERYSQADFQGAVGLLEQARQATDDPYQLSQIYMYLGVNQEILGQIEAAQSAFRQALKNDPQLRLDPQRFRAPAVVLFNEVLASLSGSLQIQGERANATIWLDGKLFGAPPLTTVLPIGRHQLQLRGSSGELLLAQDILVKAGSVVTLMVPPEPTSQPASQAVYLLPPPASHPTRPKASPPARHRLWTWITAGAAVLSLGAASGMGLWANADHQSWEETLAAGEDRERWEELADSGQAKELSANILFGVAGGLAVTAVVLYFLEGRAPVEKESRAAVRKSAASLQLSGAGLQVEF